jgi:hypothetical protein
VYSTALHGTALHGTALHGTALHCAALHGTALRCTALLCAALQPLAAMVSSSRQEGHQAPLATAATANSTATSAGQHLLLRETQAASCLCRRLRLAMIQ